MGTAIGGIRIVDMPDLGEVDDTSSMVGKRAGSGRFSATALRSYIGANYVPLSGGAVANAGVFDGNRMHDALSVMVNGASSLTEFQFAYPGETSVEAFAAGLVVPAGMTAYSANAISAYLQNASTAADFAAGVRSYVRNTAPGATSYALHLKATDRTTAAPVASTVVGNEIDMGAYNVASRAIRVQRDRQLPGQGASIGGGESGPGGKCAAAVGLWLHLRQTERLRWHSPPARQRWSRIAMGNRYNSRRETIQTP